MRTVESLHYTVYGQSILVRHVHDDGPALWVERTTGGRYHLCDDNGSIEVYPTENIDAIVEDWKENCA